jgi:hypothetical protein
MDYQPLLPPGIHDLTEDELDNHFQSGFQNSTTRSSLIVGLKSFMNALRASGVEFELWIDGSFTTQKENPNDIDLVAFAPSAALNGLPPQQQAILQSLFDRISSRSTFGCDVLRQHHGCGNTWKIGTEGRKQSGRKNCARSENRKSAG